MRVLGWRVERVDLQRFLADIRDVVPAARGHKDDPIVLDLALKGQLVSLWAHLHPSMSGFDAQELIAVGVHLQADVVTRFDMHDCHLEVRAGPQRAAVVLVAERGSFDVDDERVRTFVGERRAGNRRSSLRVHAGAFKLRGGVMPRAH